MGNDGRSEPIQTCTITETITMVISIVMAMSPFGPFEKDMENVAQRYIYLFYQLCICVCNL